MALPTRPGIHSGRHSLPAARGGGAVPRITARRPLPPVACLRCLTSPAPRDPCMSQRLISQSGTPRGRLVPPCPTSTASSDGPRPSVRSRSSPRREPDPRDTENELRSREGSPSSAMSSPEPNKRAKSTLEEFEPEEGDKEGITPALSLLRFYKANVSPLLPPSCRFLPTCSEYAAKSYKQFGLTKGTILTAWRLLRCNPLNPGGWQYEPADWPPPGALAFLGKILP